MKDTGMTFEVAVGKKVYDVYLKPTNKEPKRNRPKRPELQKLPHHLTAEACELCGSVKFSGICMNSKCVS